ncbi:hypothetical protein JXR93_00140, partial [bacterium]|nr:hypothetical protein [bacterium]
IEVFMLKKNSFYKLIGIALFSLFFISCGNDTGETILKLFIDKNEISAEEKASLKAIVNSSEEEEIVFSTFNGGFGDDFEKKLIVETIEQNAITEFGCNGYIGTTVILVEFKKEETAIRTEIVCK